jgi:general stress protein YciG
MAGKDKTERTETEKQSSKGNMSVREAGQKGGEATSATHGHEFYQEIGHKGGEAGGKKGGQRVRELIEEGKKSEEGGGEER